MQWHSILYRFQKRRDDNAIGAKEHEQRRRNAIDGRKKGNIVDGRKKGNIATLLWLEDSEGEDGGCFQGCMTENAVEDCDNVLLIQDICCEEAIVKCYLGDNFDF